MAKDNEDSYHNKSSSPNDPESDKSFVKKVKSRVSGFLPSSISKWFGGNESHVRQRDELEEEDDDETIQLQPPTKRVKPSDSNYLMPSFHPLSDSTPVHSQNAANNVDYGVTKLNSIFPEPSAGPSGIKSRKLLTPASKSCAPGRGHTSREVLNGDKYSDSGESTSGYSSMIRIGSKEPVVETNESAKPSTSSGTSKNAKYLFNTSPGNNDRSLFSERSLSPQVNSSLSSRQPSFNASMFGSPNFVDKTLSSKRIMNSPFYNGRTIYGGASAAYTRPINRPVSDVRPLKNTVQIRPKNEKASSDNACLSKTARRILDTLEQYSTPLMEAKKIPNPTLKRSMRHVAASPYSVREKGASTRELQVPTVPDLLKMKLKERLQDSTVSVRQIATTSKSSLNQEWYKIRSPDNTGKRTNKMNSTFSTGTVEEVKLPDVQLPISTLPKFDFSLSAPTTSTPIVKSTSETVSTSSATTLIKTVENGSTKIIENKIEMKTVTSKTEAKKPETKKMDVIKESEKVKVTEFKFADPLVISENLKSVKAINNFIFIEPVSSKFKNKTALEVDVGSNFICPEPKGLKLRKKVPNGESSEIPVVKELRFGKKEAPQSNLMDKFKSSLDTWECSVCLIRNIVQKTKCAACEAPKPQPKSKSEASTSGFGDKFKLSSGQWSCKTCLVVNSSAESKCVACESPNVEVSATNSKNGFGNQFKLSADKWECQACLVRNNNADKNCVSCATPRAITNGTKPGASTQVSGFGNKFKAVNNTWECKACYVRNNNDLDKCIACETPKPITSSTSTTPKTSSSVQANDTGFNSMFKKKQDEWECDSCLLRNKSDVTKCMCCESPKPGTAPVLNVPSGKGTLSSFNFGIDKNSRTTAHGFVFGINPDDKASKSESKTTSGTTSLFAQTAGVTSTTPTGFTFGIKPVQEKSEAADKPKDNAVISSTLGDSFNKEKESQLETKQPAPGGFVFGNTTPTAKPATPGGFVFGSTTPTLKRSATSSSDENAVSNAKKTTVETATPITSLKSTVPTVSSFSANGGDKTQTFSMPTKIEQTNLPANNITFVANKIKDVTPAATTAPMFSFGAKPATTIPQQPSSSLFGANTSTQPPMFNFTAAPAKPAVNESTPTFSAPSANVLGGGAPPKPVSIFGGGAALPTVPAFGGQPAQEPKPFAFNSQKEEPLSKVPAMAFAPSAKSEEPAVKTNLFSFGSAAASEAASNKFSFPQNAAQPVGGFNFNPTAAPFALPQPAQNGAFNFGSSANSTPKTGFNFGATQVPAANPAGIFTFGSTSNQAPAATGGFNFASTAEVKPNINFTAGAPPSAFSAQPTPQSSRVMRKGVRRTQR